MKMQFKVFFFELEFIFSVGSFSQNFSFFVQVSAVSVIIDNHM